MTTNENPMERRHYFVDEAGDPNIIKNKRIIVGKDGCSSFFMLGVLDVRDVKALSADLDDLSTRLNADPYLKGIPSMRPEAKKTAVLFHAKDDVPEVRYEVFRMLMAHDVRFYAAIRDKKALAAYAQQRLEQDTDYRYPTDKLYSTLVRRLFRGLLHLDPQYTICFARRGWSDRTQALQDALISARQDYQELSGVGGDGEIQVSAPWSAQSRALQAADYFLWALQRLFERNESRYWEYVWPKVRCVIDLDDMSRNPKGEHYTQDNPLTGTLRNSKT